MDLLSLVREATKNHTDVNYVEGYYIFGKYKFHESTKTAFRRTLRSKWIRCHPSPFCHDNIIGGGHYTLRDVIFFLENADLPLSEYRQKVQDARVTAVVVQDQSNLKKYLTGEIDHCEQIDLGVVNASIADAVDADHVVRAAAGAKLAIGAMEEQRKRFADILEQNAKSSWTFRYSMRPVSAWMTNSLPLYVCLVGVAIACTSTSTPNLFQPTQSICAVCAAMSSPLLLGAMCSASRGR